MSQPKNDQARAESGTDPLISEQIDYYRARADEYDEWYHRQGLYDHGEEPNRLFDAELRALEDKVESFARVDDILDLAGGTGWWTRLFMKSGASVTAVDASAEVLAHNRRRNGEHNVRYIQADLFSWKPDQQYDLVFFAFWLSHVPPERFEVFWSVVGESVKPGGKVLFADTLKGGMQKVAAKNHPPLMVRATQRIGL